jgi:hypothetical protein
MKLRLVVAVLLLLVAVGLPVAAISNNGKPWGFRGHAAVLVDVTGDVQATASETRRVRSAASDDKLSVAPNLHLDTGDELRVARLSRAVVRFPTAEVVVGDGGRVVVADGGVALGRGALAVRLPAGSAARFTVAFEGGRSVIVRGGSAQAEALFLADGKGAVRALVRDGSLEVAGGERPVLVESGRMLVLDGGGAAVAEPPSALVATASCAEGRVSIVAPPTTQLFVAGSLVYPDALAGAATGSTSVDAAGARAVSVFARDVVGNVVRVVADCAPPVAPVPGRSGR